MRILALASIIAIVAGLATFVLFKGKWPFPRKQAAIETPTPTPKLAGDPKIKVTPLSCQAGNCSLEVEIIIRGECHMGDFNFIFIDLEQGSDKQVIRLSIEPLLQGEAEFAAIGEEIGLAQLEKGFKKTFSLPKFQKPVQLGVFLCKDSKNEGRCAGKEVMDLDEGMSKLFAGLIKDRKYKSPDRVYFFQYVFWEAEGQIAIFDDQDPLMMTDDLYKLRLDYIMGRSPEYALEKLKAMERIKDVSRTLRSVPLELASSKISLVLPKNKGCEK